MLGDAFDCKTGDNKAVLLTQEGCFEDQLFLKRDLDGKNTKRTVITWKIIVFLILGISTNIFLRKNYCKGQTKVWI